MSSQHTQNSFNLVDPDEYFLVCTLNTLVSSQKRFFRLMNVFEYPCIPGSGFG